MDAKKIQYFKNKLLEEKRKHDNTLNGMKELNIGESGRYSADELSNYDNHPADMGTQLFDLEFGMALQVNEEYNIKEIEDALQRIENGSYGKCELCGKEIGEERLEIVPATRLCIECEKEKKLDVSYLADERPVEEKVIRAPLGRKYFNAPEPTDDEHEGMDQLNDLMKYGSSDSPQDLGDFADYKEYYTNEIDHQGLVDEMDQISNKDYKRQLPD